MAMDTATAVVGTGLIVALGRWAKNEKLSIQNFVGIGVLAVGLAMLGAINAEFAAQFSVLVLVAAMMYYLVPITKALGFTK
jgi:small basic protein